MIKIANIIEDSRLGGPQIRIQRVACILETSECIDTTVILPNTHSEAFCDLLQKCNIKYKKVFLSGITKQLSVAFRYLFFSWLEVLYLVYYFRKNKFDIVHVSGGSWQYKGVIAGKLSGCKVIWHLNDTSMSFVFKLIFKGLSKLPDYYIYASERTRKYYLSWNKSTEVTSSIIRQPVNTELYSPDVIPSGFVNLARKYNNKFVVGTVANINPTKDIMMFLRVAAEVNKDISDVVFIVVGPVHKSQNLYYKQLEKLVEDLNLNNVEFIGYSDEVQAYMRLFDVFLCTSISEAGPMTLWEAMSCSTAVVSTDVGDVNQFVKNDLSGYVVDVGDYRAMGGHVLALLKDNNKIKSFGKKGREIVVQNMSSEICAEQHILAYKKAIQ